MQLKTSLQIHFCTIFKRVMGHPFMISTRKSSVWLLSLCPHETDQPLSLMDVHLPSTWNTHH